MAYYRVCPYCGCNIDPGEICDCRTEQKKEAAPLARERPQAKTPAYSLSAQSPAVKEFTEYCHG